MTSTETERRPYWLNGENVITALNNLSRFRFKGREYYAVDEVRSLVFKVAEEADGTFAKADATIRRLRADAASLRSQLEHSGEHALGDDLPRRGLTATNIETMNRARSQASTIVREAQEEAQRIYAELDAMYAEADAVLAAARESQPPASTDDLEADMTAQILWYESRFAELRDQLAAKVEELAKVAGTASDGVERLGAIIGRIETGGVA